MGIDPMHVKDFEIFTDGMELKSWCVPTPGAPFAQFSRMGALLRLYDRRPLCRLFGLCFFLERWT